MEVINTALEMFVPTKCIKPQNHKSLQHYPYYIRQLCRKRKAAWKVYRRFRVENLYTKYVKVDCTCKEAVHKYEVEKEHKLVDNGNIGRFYVNNRLVAKTGVGLIKDQSRHMLHDDKDKAECFNRFFRMYLCVIMELYQILMRR